MMTTSIYQIAIANCDFVVGDETFISTATSIAPRIINCGNSQISFFMVLIEGTVP